MNNENNMEKGKYRNCVDFGAYKSPNGPYDKNLFPC